MHDLGSGRGVVLSSEVLGSKKLLTSQCSCKLGEVTVDLQGCWED